MSSNRLYNLFQSKHLHRKDIETYGATQDTALKNSIEQKAASNSFDSDAFDGAINGLEKMDSYLN